MNARIRAALDGSIKKWERIVRSTEALDKNSENCPLCQECFECNECPVNVKTKEESCKLTPWIDWMRHLTKDHAKFKDYGNRYKLHRIPGCKECLRLAKAELAFLIGLRELG